MNITDKYNNIPVLAVKGIIVYPYVILTIDALRNFSVNAVEHSINGDHLVFVTSQTDLSNDNPGFEDVYKEGTLCCIKQILKLPNNATRVLLEGLKPAQLLAINKKEPFLAGDIEILNDDEIKRLTKNNEALLREVADLFEKYYSLSNHLYNDALLALNSNLKEPNKFSYLISANLNIDIEEKQKLLKMRNGLKRLKKLVSIMAEEIEILKIEEKIHSQVKEKIDKHQKEYYLREQLRAIQSELGESEDLSSDAENYFKKLDELILPDEVKEKLFKEIKRLTSMPASSHEALVINGYLQTVFDMPWNVKTQENTDLKKSESILNKEHYGLCDVKKRIMEHIAVYSGTKAKKSTVLCFVGPPGVGKTSIASSIARATGRKFHRLSLGGVRDEADIRGHRKTYIGAMPGRIINAIKLSGSSNPVILLDEIDKMASDFRGDPGSALLEVLDREQNFNFRDHYLEVPYDLSDVMFITTANTTSSIPPALLDRMEIIELSSYTRLEKINIAIKHLIPKLLSELSTDKTKINVLKSAVCELVDYYTIEAGVRNLERELSNLIRKALFHIKKNDIKSVRISDKDVAFYLGQRKFIDQSVTKIEEPGLATGLAYTSYGGTLINIETNILDGTGKVELTGKLGDVMKESAMAAICYIRSNADKFKLDKNFYKKKDIHIHIPEGATPKDGPSAGVTMATALVSALTDKKVRSDIAMTGEVTIRGRVLAIGGLKEKALAAHRNGIFNIIIPYDNLKDIETIPEEVRDDFNFIPVKNMNDVLHNAIGYIF